MENKCEVFFKCERLLIWKALLFLGLILSLPLLLNDQSSAQPKANITITASVLPARYIEVDKENTIKKIISNTKDDVTPQVCFDSCLENIVELTPHISKQYQAIMSKNAKSSIGIIYQRAENNNTHQELKTNNTYAVITHLLIAASIIILV